MCVYVCARENVIIVGILDNKLNLKKKHNQKMTQKNKFAKNYMVNH